MIKSILFFSTCLFSFSPVYLAQAADWSTTELHIQHGDIQKAFQGGNNDSDTNGTTILTFQHASGWKYGDNFFFFDHLNYGRTDFEKANNLPEDDELYGEWYSNFSLGKMTQRSFEAGVISDVGLLMGFNYAAEVDTLYYLPGIRLSLSLPGFAFSNLDITAYVQNNASNVSNDVKIKEDSSYMVDFNWAYPFNIGTTSWSLEGHIEYIDGVDTKVHVSGLGTLDGKRESWLLAQPQLRLDIGELIGESKDKLFLGIEYQYWKNKLGDKDTDENVVQLLMVWRM